MNKMTVLSLVAATMLFTGCGEKTKEAATAATDAVASATDTVIDKAADAAAATKKAAEEAAAAAAEKAAAVAAAAKAEAEKVAAAAAEKAAAAKAAAEKKAADAAAALKERAAATTEAVTAAVTPENAAGKAVYAKCAGCHGADGKTKALGKGNPVAGQTAAALAEALHAYKAGTRNVSGMGMLMKGQVAAMDDATITAVSEYMAGL